MFRLLRAIRFADGTWVELGNIQLAAGSGIDARRDCFIFRVLGQEICEPGRQR